MRLKRATLHAVCLPYHRPVRWSDVVEDGATFLLLHLESDQGFEGVAEMTAKPTWTGFGLRTLSAALEEVLLPRLATADLGDGADVARRLDAVPGLHAPKAVLDNALWDLQADASGVPLWQRWGGRDRVPVSFTITRQAPDLMAREATELVGRLGLRCLKIKAGQGRELDVQALLALKRAVGDQVDFYVDANGAYPCEEAVRFAQAMFEAGARVVEDPCPLAPGDAFSRLQAQLPGPVLVDFPCWSTRDATSFIEAGARAFSLKPGRFGLSVSRALEQQSQAVGATTVVGMFGESAIGTWQALAQASTQDERALPAEVTWYLSMRHQVTQDIPEIVDGHIRLPLTASVARRIDWAQVRRYASAPALSINL